MIASTLHSPNPKLIPTYTIQAKINIGKYTLEWFIIVQNLYNIPQNQSITQGAINTKGVSSLKLFN